MRVHDDKTIIRRAGVSKLNQYQDARDILTEDFFGMCGYCGKNGKRLHQKFHIDHFVPKKRDPDREKDYYNLVLACPKCNLSKANKWPTNDINKPNDGEVGFLDPATAEFDEHIKRNKDGYVMGKTPLGRVMCKLLNLDIRRSDLYWKISLLYRQQDELEHLHRMGKLTNLEKSFYIDSNILLKQYIDNAFEEGE